MPPRTPRHIASYYEALAAIQGQGAAHEGATRFAFQTLLAEAGRPLGLTVVAEPTVRLPNGQRIRLDGELRDRFSVPRGVWEAKDPADDLEREIGRKLKAGYPASNTVFENTRRAVLYQNGAVVLDLDITRPDHLERLLERFLGHSEPRIEAFHKAVAEFGSRIPALAAALAEIIEAEERGNPAFRTALAAFLELCRASLNPSTRPAEVKDMLGQHLLTERIFRSVFKNADFVRRNAIAQELERVVSALTSRSFSRDDFLEPLDGFYRAIEEAARTIGDYGEKQTFLHTVYERFFQSYSTSTADTHGIVYTPAPVVRWMVASVEAALGREFGRSLGDRGVHVLDPCVGTGTFVLELLERVGGSDLEHKYLHELHCNEVLLLPYYVAAQNIEHEFFERARVYRPFPGVCFADTLEMGRAQASMFAPENTERVRAQEAAPIQVVLGNPPYNVGQANENDNNKNRKYPEVDRRIRETYGRSSRASLQTKLYDMYVRFFRWATDRLGDRDGVVCFVTPSSFVHKNVFDGMRLELAKDFTAIYTLDLGGSVKDNPKLSGSTHNVFGIQPGVAITLLVRKRGGQPQSAPAAVHYARLDEFWRRGQKLAYLESITDYTGVSWQRLTPDGRGHWLTEGLENDFDSFLPLGSREAKRGEPGAGATIFGTYSLGVSTNRDEWVYGFDKEGLEERVGRTIEFYNEQVLAWQHRRDTTVEVDEFVRVDEGRIKWSRNLKADLKSGRRLEFVPSATRPALRRPFVKASLYFAEGIVDELGMHRRFFPTPESHRENLLIVVSDKGARSPFGVLATNMIPDLHVLASTDAYQCFPFYVYDEDGSSRRENVTDEALLRFRERYGQEVTRWDVFHSVYGLLHSPEYRERYAGNLKRDLARVPLVEPEAFGGFLAAGRALAKLHVDFEGAAEHPLRHVEDRAVPWTWRVERMRLTRDRTGLVVNDALTLAGIPAEVFEYRLGNRSALEWLVDQLQVSTDRRSGLASDPNDPEDPQKIVRLVKKVVTVSLETVRLVRGLPGLGGEDGREEGSP